MMKMTSKHKQVSDPLLSMMSTYRLAICYECFAIADKVIHTKTDKRALAAGGAQ
jgi:hypothetical protein